MTKRPITPNGLLDATLNHEQISEWWNRTPNANVAISVPDGLCVLDVDSQATLEEIKQYLPDTVLQSTPREGMGYHYWYRLPKGVTIPPRTEFIGGLDLRSKGSYVMVHPSKHPNGGSYEWINHFDVHEIADIPDWVLQESAEKEKAARPAVDPELVLAGVQEGGRQIALFRYACYLRRKGIHIEEAKILLEEAAASAKPPWSHAGAMNLVDRVYRKYPDGSKESISKKKWNLKDLLNHEFEKVEWVVKEILPPGFCVFSSDPKLGKSMIMGNLSLAVSEGAKAFGRFETNKCDVAYADMEQGEEFCQARWNAILGGRAPIGNIDIFFDWARIGDGCVKQLRDYLAANPKVRLFVMDILANVWPAKDLVTGTVYQKEYAIISSLAKVAKEFNISIVGVHHKSKNKKEQDNVMQASGSVGIVAAADVIWSLERKRDDQYGFLHVSGKNVENRTIRMLTDGIKWSA